MKYVKSRNQYESNNGNCTLNPSTMEGYSYKWWRMCEMFRGTLVVNSFYYSSTTRKHQSQLREALRELGYAGWLEIEAPDGLQNLHSARDHYVNKINDLISAISKPRSHGTVNAYRYQKIDEYANTIRIIEALQSLRDKVKKCS